MIKSIAFKKFRNLDNKYVFSENLNIIVGKNNSGKSNLLDGIRLAFSTISNDYFKIEKSDFFNSDDSIPIEIKVELDRGSIKTLMEFDENGNELYGFKVLVKKTQKGRYVKEVSLLNGGAIDYEILMDDCDIPNVNMIPLSRIDSLFTNNLSCSISSFLNNDKDYETIKEKTKDKIKEQISEKTTRFQELCSKFNQSLDIEMMDPTIRDEKIYIVEHNAENLAHCYKIGSGYKSVANILINTLNDGHNIILIDEIENHLHPALIRTLIREMHSMENVKIVATTHSAVVLNEIPIEEIMDISGVSLNTLKSQTRTKLQTFLHPGRGEMILADNVLLVEGYTEELLFKNYLLHNNQNWTVINVEGVMFEPYIDLCRLLNKKIVVVSDNDITKKDGINPTNRFINLRNTCEKEEIKLIEVYNTLESDLYKNGFLEGVKDCLEPDKNYSDIMIAKEKKKTEIAIKLIENNVDLKKWHVVEEIISEFNGN